MYKVKAFITNEGFGQLGSLSVKRDWMDETYDAHAYKCFPVSLTNQMGWSISFPEDISFIWDGISDTSSDHVKILQGEKYAYTTRSNASISFHTGISFETEKNVTLLQMPVPNNFIDGVVPFTTLMSTSFFKGELPVVWRITRPNVEITIKAGTPIISILPVDLENLQNSEIDIRPYSEFVKPDINMQEYAEKIYNTNKEGKYSNFYRNAEDHMGNSLGSHQVKAIRMSVVDNRNSL
jgi:hypothetical protein